MQRLLIAMMYTSRPSCRAACCLGSADCLFGSLLSIVAAVPSTEQLLARTGTRMLQCSRGTHALQQDKSTDTMSQERLLRNRQVCCGALPKKVGKYADSSELSWGKFTHCHAVCDGMRAENKVMLPPRGLAEPLLHSLKSLCNL